MAFNLVRLSQQDPRWKNTKLGYSSDSTIGAYGCAMTSVCMWLSGFGFPETPDSLNAKLKANGGYVQDAIIWGAVCSLYPKVKYKNLILCRDTDAPIDAIGNAIAAGQPVLLEVDSSPKAGLQTHWVVAYQKVGKDFYILDPWPYPTEEGKDISLMARYSQGKELKRAITAVVFYEAQGGSEIVPVEPPSDGYYLRVMAGLDAGLRLRSAATTASDTLALEASGSFLKVMETEATARPKVGIYDQWIRVQDSNGLEGYVAAWYVENAPTSSNPPNPPNPPDNPPVTNIKRTRPSVADGLESIPTAAPSNQQLTPAASATATPRLAADIWNRYGGLLYALSGVLAIQPGVAVAVLAIESGGQAFGADGRMIIRFENHLFYQYWGKNNQTQFNKFFTFNTTQRWLGHKWRASETDIWRDPHTGQSGEWEAFNFACTLDATAAKMSISMGAPQVMGFNCGIIGYETANDMFTAFSASERDQVIGFFDFVQGVLPNAGAVKALQSLDFLTFATYYNGSGQAAYYRDRMKAAYDAFVSLGGSTQVPPPPTPGTPPTPPPDNPPVEPPVNPPSEGIPHIKVIVIDSVGKTGANLRERPTPYSPLVTNVPAGSYLTALEHMDIVRPQIGKRGQWIKVRDRRERVGYISAIYVKADTTDEPVVFGLSFDVADLTTAQPLTVHVSALAGQGGLVLRRQPNSAAGKLATLPVDTPLTVLDDPEATKQKIGKFRQWLKVKTSQGLEGYVAAWYVEK